MNRIFGLLVFILLGSCISTKELKEIESNKISLLETQEFFPKNKNPQYYLFPKSNELEIPNQQYYQLDSLIYKENPDFYGIQRFNDYNSEEPEYYILIAKPDTIYTMPNRKPDSSVFPTLP